MVCKPRDRIPFGPFGPLNGALEEHMLHIQLRLDIANSNRLRYLAGAMAGKAVEVVQKPSDYFEKQICTMHVVR